MKLQISNWLVGGDVGKSFLSTGGIGNVSLGGIGILVCCILKPESSLCIQEGGILWVQFDRHVFSFLPENVCVKCMCIFFVDIYLFRAKYQSF